MANNTAASTSESPTEFSFPFKPYDIQVDFMKALYETLNEGKIGIFESPTGTGKSLSIICGAMTWLRHQQAEQCKRLAKLQSLVQEENVGLRCDSAAVDNSEDDEFSWVTEQHERRQQLNELLDLKLEQQLLSERRDRLKKRMTQWKRKANTTNDSEDDELGHGEAAEHCSENDDTDLLLEDYVSGDEADNQSSSDEESEEDDHCLKIYYCSRTHSQLSQFVHEVQKTSFCEDVRLVTLGSRQNMCINSEVRQLRSVTRINDRCLELQKNRTKNIKEGSGKKKKRSLQNGCPYYQHTSLSHLKDHILAKVADIEHIVPFGQELKACPYYASRFAIGAAELVVMPYQLLLHSSSRAALGIKLKGNCVIIDEAHNLMDTLSAMYSILITTSQLTTSISQLQQYQDKYRSRLKASNLVHNKQLLFVLTELLTFMKHSEVKAEYVEVCTITDFLHKTNLDNVNLFKVHHYCQQSKISKKLSGFAERYSLQSVGLDGEQASATSPLQYVENFVEALTAASNDGRIVVTRQVRPSQSSLKFLLLNPCSHFADVVRECRSVVVAGGTMKPTTIFREQLFLNTGVDADRIYEFACGHVIPAEQLLCVSLEKGPSGLPLDFTFKSRDNPEQMAEAGRVIENLTRIIPGGIVCFFPSYAYQQKALESWKGAGLVSRMERKKKVFFEPKRASDVEQVLSDYSRCCKFTNAENSEQGHSGALLFAVVGGKMSEGINFADSLGRCVIMIGLPYPNLRSAELNEKMEYFNMQSSNGGNRYYQNLCMKAVNQSIGRAIRHSCDYASIVLLDQRYQEEAVQGHLPKWIHKSYHSASSFSAGFSLIRK